MEKIKLFAKKNNEEKKENRKLIERIGDWMSDEENLPLVTYGVGIAVGLGCGYLIGHTFGRSSQAAKDAKEVDEFMKGLDEGFKIDAVKGARPGLKITGLDIYGKPITKVIGTDVQTAKKLADDLGNITEEIITEIDVTNTIADQMRAAGMKNVQVF